MDGAAEKSTSAVDQTSTTQTSNAVNDKLSSDAKATSSELSSNKTPVKVQEPIASSSLSTFLPQAVPVMSKDAEKNNRKLWPHFREQLSNTNETVFVPSAQKLARWLSDIRAYYPGARPHIVGLLETAHRTTRAMLGLPGNTYPTFDSEVLNFQHMWDAHRTWLDSYAYLIRAVIPFLPNFVEPELQTRLRSIINSLPANFTGISAIPASYPRPASASAIPVAAPLPLGALHKGTQSTSVAGSTRGPSASLRVNIPPPITAAAGPSLHSPTPPLSASGVSRKSSLSTPLPTSSAPGQIQSPLSSSSASIGTPSYSVQRPLQVHTQGIPQRSFSQPNTLTPVQPYGPSSPYSPYPPSASPTHQWSHNQTRNLVTTPVAPTSYMHTASGMPVLVQQHPPTYQSVPVPQSFSRPSSSHSSRPSSSAGLPNRTGSTGIHSTSGAGSKPNTPILPSQAPVMNDEAPFSRPPMPTAQYATPSTPVTSPSRPSSAGTVLPTVASTSTAPPPPPAQKVKSKKKKSFPVRLDFLQADLAYYKEQQEKQKEQQKESIASLTQATSTSQTEKEKQPGDQGKSMDIPQASPDTQEIVSAKEQELTKQTQPPLVDTAKSDLSSPVIPSAEASSGQSVSNRSALDGDVVTNASLAIDEKLVPTRPTSPIVIDLTLSQSQNSVVVEDVNMEPLSLDKEPSTSIPEDSESTVVSPQPITSPTHLQPIPVVLPEPSTIPLTQTPVLSSPHSPSPITSTTIPLAAEPAPSTDISLPAPDMSIDEDVTMSLIEPLPLDSSVAHESQNAADHGMNEDNRSFSSPLPSNLAAESSSAGNASHLTSPTAVSPSPSLAPAPPSILSPICLHHIPSPIVEDHSNTPASDTLPPNFTRKPKKLTISRSTVFGPQMKVLGFMHGKLPADIHSHKFTFVVSKAQLERLQMWERRYDIDDDVSESLCHR
ncbi:hypothetical protein C8Q75DRAFT_738380 [Abortiporus biennis]|nr:hypothetical protein C8Q75DRAFT_738380 [Abortiporus biennis]